MRRFYPDNPTNAEIEEYEKLVKELKQAISDFKMIYRDEPMFPNLYLAEQLHKLIEGETADLNSNVALMTLALRKNDFHELWGEQANLPANLKLADELSRFFKVDSDLSGEG